MSLYIQLYPSMLGDRVMVRIDWAGCNRREGGGDVDSPDASYDI